MDKNLSSIAYVVFVLIFLWALGAALHFFIGNLSKVKILASLKDFFNNKNKMEIVLASEDDRGDVLNLLKENNGDESDFDIKSFYVAKLKGKLVGCIRAKIFSDGTLELASLAVNGEFRNQGIGSSLVKRLLEKENKRPIFLLTSAGKENFYNKFGFKIIEPNKLSGDFEKEYQRIISLPFFQDIEVVIMHLEGKYFK